jgi:hypothetical protein
MLRDGAWKPDLFDVLDEAIPLIHDKGTLALHCGARLHEHPFELAGTLVAHTHEHDGGLPVGLQIRQNARFGDSGHIDDDMPACRPSSSALMAVTRVPFGSRSASRVPMWMASPSSRNPASSRSIIRRRRV